MARILLLLLLAGCTALDPHNMIGRQMGDATGVPTEPVPSAMPAQLDARGRERAFDFVWSTIQQRYHDANLNGVDWNGAGARYQPLALGAPDDEAFWDVLDRMTGELKDAHTRVDSPRRVELRKRDEAITLGFSFAPLEGKLAITSVSPESDAWWAGVRSGMTLASIAGEPAWPAYQKLLSETRLDSTERSRHLRALRRLTMGDENTSVDFTFERADGTRIEAAVARRKFGTRAWASHRILPSGFGYVRLTQWTLGVLPRALEGLEAVAKTPGIVIDLRGNPGGSVHVVNALLSRFFPHRMALGNSTTRTGRPISLLFGSVDIIKLKSEVEGNKDAYTGPVVILVNALSASGSELFAGTLQAVGRASVVGEPSCGCLLGFLGYTPVPGGGELAYSEVGFVMASGKRIEGEGVMPDRVVPATLADLQLARDRPLEEAQALLRTLPAWTR